MVVMVLDANALRADYVAHALVSIQHDRRALHRIPEIGHCEFETQKYLLQALRELEPDMLHTIADTGLRCVFCGQADTNGKKRRTIALRSDIDALDVTETTGRNFKSERTGFMHACGHDGHMATMLAVARFCAENRARLRDNVVIFFQPAEEDDGGSERIIAAGGMRNPDVDEVYGMHVMPTLESGTIACPDGPLMASTCELDITVEGTASHGAMPHLGRDALAAAVALYNMLQTVFTRQTDPFEQKVLTIGAMRAGERRNVVADKAYMQATLRTYDENIEKQCIDLMRAHARAIETAYDVKCHIERLSSYLPVINDTYAAGRVRAVAGEMCVPVHPLTIAEDFSFYQRQAPGAFFFCGVKQGDKYSSPLHASDFDFDESSLLNGLKVFIGLIDLI